MNVSTCCTDPQNKSARSQAPAQYRNRFFCSNSNALEIATFIRTRLNDSNVCIICFLCWVLSFARPLSAELVLSFDELAAYTTTGATGSYYDGYGPTATLGTWESQGVTFNTTGAFGEGWSYSNVNDSTMPGHLNQWAAYPGTGVGGAGNYVIGSAFNPNKAFFNLPNGQTVNSISVSNTTYTALSMLTGDSIAKKFGGMTGNDPDFLRVTFTGFGATDTIGGTTGSVEYFLADYRFSNNSLDYVVNDWRLVDLTPLGNARSIGIGIDGSDVGSFGLNTPAYVAIDNLTFSSIPEPSSLVLLATGGWMTLSRRRKQFGSSGVSVASA